MKMSEQVHPAYGKIPQSLSGYFGLRGFPGKVFILNFQKSYNDQLVIDIYDETNGTRMNFSSGTLEEILREVV